MGTQVKKKSHWSRLGKLMAFHSLTIVNAVVQILVVLLSTQVSLFPGVEAMQSIAGSFAEIIAGLYGLTLASYTFFLSRIDGLAASDPTLDYVTAGLKRKFKYLIWHITYQVFLSLVFSSILMYMPELVAQKIPFFYRLFCNEFIIFFAMAVILILYYSVAVVAPNAIPKEAAKLRKRLDLDAAEPGSLTQFIALYDAIEARCSRLVPENVLAQIQQSKGKRLAYTILLMCELHPQLKDIHPELERVHRYYDCVINCEKPAVSAAMVQLAKGVLGTLENQET